MSLPMTKSDNVALRLNSLWTCILGLYTLTKNECVKFCFQLNKVKAAKARV